MEDEARQIAASSNPNERNRKISTAYAAMALRRPDMEWIGLAAVVSRQAGCAMDHADQAMKSPIPMVSGPAKAAKAIDAGDLRTASDLIANHEQKDIVQSQIHNQKRFKEVFEQNEYWADTMLGRYFGAKPAEIAMSSRCNGGGEIPLKGSIGNANDRVSCYETLMRHFRDKGEAWRNQTMTDTVQQGQ